MLKEEWHFSWAPFWPWIRRWGVYLLRNVAMELWMPLVGLMAIGSAFSSPTWLAVLDLLVGLPLLHSRAWQEWIGISCMWRGHEVSHGRFDLVLVGSGVAVSLTTILYRVAASDEVVLWHDIIYILLAVGGVSTLLCVKQQKDMGKIGSGGGQRRLPLRALPVTPVMVLVCTTATLLPGPSFASLPYALLFLALLGRLISQSGLQPLGIVARLLLLLVTGVHCTLLLVLSMWGQTAPAGLVNVFGPVGYIVSDAYPADVVRGDTSELRRSGMRWTGVHITSLLLLHFVLTNVAKAKDKEEDLSEARRKCDEAKEDINAVEGLHDRVNSERCLLEHSPTASDQAAGDTGDASPSADLLLGGAVASKLPTDVERIRMWAERAVQGVFALTLFVFALRFPSFLTLPPLLEAFAWSWPSQLLKGCIGSTLRHLRRCACCKRCACGQRCGCSGQCFGGCERCRCCPRRQVNARTRTAGARFETLCCSVRGTPLIFGYLVVIFFCGYVYNIWLYGPRLLEVPFDWLTPSRLARFGLDDFRGGGVNTFGALFEEAVLLAALAGLQVARNLLADTRLYVCYTQFVQRAVLCLVKFCNAVRENSPSELFMFFTLFLVIGVLRCEDGKASPFAIIYVILLALLVVMGAGNSSARRETVLWLVLASFAELAVIVTMIAYVMTESVSPRLRAIFMMGSSTSPCSGLFSWVIPHSAIFLCGSLQHYFNGQETPRERTQKRKQSWREWFLQMLGVAMSRVRSAKQSLKSFLEETMFLVVLILSVLTALMPPIDIHSLALLLIVGPSLLLHNFPPKCLCASQRTREWHQLRVLRVLQYFASSCLLVRIVATSPLLPQNKRPLKYVSYEELGLAWQLDPSKFVLLGTTAILARLAGKILQDSMHKMQANGADDTIPDERGGSPSSDVALDPSDEQVMGPHESGYLITMAQHFDEQILARWAPSWLPARFHIYLSALLLFVSFVVSCNEIHLLNFLWISAVVALCGWSQHWVRAGDVFAVTTVGIMIVQYAFRFQVWQGVMEESWIKQIGLQWKQEEVVKHSSILFLCIAQKHFWHRSRHAKVRKPRCPPCIERHVDIVGIMVVLLVAVARRHLVSTMMVLATLPWLVREEVPWYSQAKGQKRTKWLCFFRFVLISMLLFQLVVRLGMVFEIKGRLDGMFTWICRFWDQEHRAECVEEFHQQAQMNTSTNDQLIWEFIAIFILGYIQRLLGQPQESASQCACMWGAIFDDVDDDKTELAEEDESRSPVLTSRHKLLVMHWWPCLVWLPIFALSLEGGNLLGICSLGMLFGLTFNTGGSRLTRRRWAWRTRMCATAFLVCGLLVQSPAMPCSFASCAGLEHEIFMKHDSCMLLQAMNTSVVATEAQMRECAAGGEALGHDTPSTMALQIIGLRRVVRGRGFMSDIGVLLGSQLGWLLITIFATTVQIRIYNSGTYKSELDKVVTEDEGCRIQRAIRYVHEFHCRGGLEKLAQQERHRALRSKLKRIMKRIHQILTSNTTKSSQPPGSPGSPGSAAGRTDSGTYGCLEQDQRPVAVEEIQLSHGVSKADAEKVVDLLHEDVQACKKYLDLLQEVIVGRIQPEGDLLDAHVRSLVRLLHEPNGKAGHKRRQPTISSKVSTRSIRKQWKSVWARIVAFILSVRATLSKWYGQGLSWWDDFKCSLALATVMWDYAFLGVDEQKFKLRSLDEIAVEELYMNRMHNSPLRTFWKLILSHSLGLSGLAVVLAFVETRSVLDFLRVFVVFFVALRWFPFPPRELWTGLKIYSVVLLFLRYLYDLPIFCSDFTLRVLKSDAERQDYLWEPSNIFMWCPVLLEAGPDVTLGIAKRTGPSALRDTWWLWTVWSDHLCIWAILLHEWMLTRSGIWDYIVVDPPSQRLILRADALDTLPAEEPSPPTAPATSAASPGAPSETASATAEIPQEGSLHASLPPSRSLVRPGQSMRSAVPQVAVVARVVDFDEDTHRDLVQSYKKRRDEFIAQYESWAAEVQRNRHLRQDEEEDLPLMTDQQPVASAQDSQTPRACIRSSQGSMTGLTLVSSPLPEKMHRVSFFLEGMHHVSLASFSSIVSPLTQRRRHFRSLVHVLSWAISGAGTKDASEVDSPFGVDLQDQSRQTLSDPEMVKKFEAAALIQKWVLIWVLRMKAEMRIRCPLGHRLRRCKQCEDSVATSASMPAVPPLPLASSAPAALKQRQQTAAQVADLDHWAEEVCERCYQPMTKNDANAVWWHCKNCSYFACNSCVEKLLDSGLGMGRREETKAYLKRGAMLYWMKFGCGLYLLFYAMLVSQALIGEERSFSESVQESSFGMWTVVLLVCHLLVLIIDRVLHKWYYRNGCNTRVLDYINCGVAVVIFTLVHAVVIHSVRDVSNTREARLPLRSNTALLGYYIGWMVYMSVCMAQYKHGLPVVDTDLLRPTTAPELQGYLTEKLRMLYFLVHYNLPFVDDLRVIIDWTVVRTSLDLWMFFKVEDAHSWMFRIRHQMFVRRQSWYAEERGCFEKVYTGWLLLAGLLVVILLPIVLFSPITPFLGNVPIESAIITLELSVATACTGYHSSSSCRSMSVQLHEASATGIFEWRYNATLLEWYLSVNPSLGTDLDIQEVIWPKYSHSVWTVSPPAADNVAQLLQSAKPGGAPVMTMFQLKLNFVQNGVTRAAVPFQACSCAPSPCSASRFRWPAGISTCSGFNSSLFNQTRDWWSSVGYQREVSSPSTNASAKPVLVLEDFWAPALSWKSGSNIPEPIRRASTPGSPALQDRVVDLRLQLVDGSSNCTELLAGMAHSFSSSAHDQRGSALCGGNERWGMLAVNGNEPPRVVFELEKKARIAAEETSSWGSVIGLYAGLVFVVGKYLRAAFQDSSKRCVYEEIPDVGAFLDLVTAVQLAREHGDLRTEFQVYYELMKVLRSTDLLLTAGGFEVERYGVGRTDPCPPECAEPRHKRFLPGLTVGRGRVRPQPQQPALPL